MDIEKLKQKYAEKLGKDNFIELLGSVAGDPTEMSEMYEGLLEFIKKELGIGTVTLTASATEEEIKEFRDKSYKIMGIK